GAQPPLRSVNGGTGHGEFGSRERGGTPEGKRRIVDDAEHTLLNQELGGCLVAGRRRLVVVDNQLHRVTVDAAGRVQGVDTRLAAWRGPGGGGGGAAGLRADEPKKIGGLRGSSGPGGAATPDASARASGGRTRRVVAR